MDKLPENWTYPLIQPKLIEKYLQMKNFVDDTLYEERRLRFGKYRRNDE